MSRCLRELRLHSGESIITKNFDLFLYLLPCKSINSSTSAGNQHFLFRLLPF